MRSFLIGLLLILLGIVVLVVGIPLLFLASGLKGSFTGVIWIFPLPPLVFGNATVVKSIAGMLGVPPNLLVALFLALYILMFVVLVLILVELIRGIRRRSSTESLTYLSNDLHE